MWADQLSWSLTLKWISELTEHLAIEVHDVDAMAKARRIFIADRSGEFADVEELVAAAAHVEATGAIDIVPHGEEFAFGVEDLDAVVFTVGDIHPILSVGRNVMWDKELPWPNAWLAPGEEQAAIRRVFMHPRIVIAVGHVDVVGEWLQSHMCGAVER